MPTFQELSDLYKNDPQQYQVFMNSAEALNSMFRAPDLSDVLGERYPGNSPDVYAWGNTFLGFSLVPEDEVVYDMNAEELKTLTEKTGGLQAYLTGRPQPGGPTRYELIKEHVRSVRGQQAADSLDQHLAEFEKVMQLGLDLDQIHEEVEKGQPGMQEAPQEAVDPQPEPASTASQNNSTVKRSGR